MEAKEIKWCPQHGYPLPCEKCGRPLSQQAQKEIFEAGMNKCQSQYEEVQLEVLGDVELANIRQAKFDATGYSIDLQPGEVSQATIAHNERLGKLYRRKE